MPSGEFGIVKLGAQDTLTTKSVVIGSFVKSYLGEQGRQQVRSDISKGNWQLKPGWEDADFAVISQAATGEIIGMVAEYKSGTFVMLSAYAPGAANGGAERLHKLTNSYLAEEAKRPYLKEQWGWEDVTPGAVIREKFTAKDNITGLWAKEVAVIDPDNCNACQQCGIWCPEDAIKLDPVTGKLDIVDYDFCKGCGICDFVCPPEQNAIQMVEESQVKAAQANVFHGIYAKRMEFKGDYLKHEVDHIPALPKAEYQVVYMDDSGKKSLSGQRLIQVLHTPGDLQANQRPLLYTYTSHDGRHWDKLVRPMTSILVYGTSEYDKELAANMQLEGFSIKALASGNNGDHDKALHSFTRAGLSLSPDSRLETMIANPDIGIDAVVSAHYDNFSTAQDKLIMEKIGVLRAPFMPTTTRDIYLEQIISNIEAKMPRPVREKDDRPLALLKEHDADISSGHRLCTGCVVGTAFNLAVRTMKEIDPEYIAVHSGATGCAEVATTVYPDTSWPSFLHTTFGGLGANLEGLNAAYRYLYKTGRLKKKIKFFGWGGDGGTYDIGLQALSGFLERGLATDSVYFCYDNGAYMNTGIQRSSATPLGAGTSTSPVGEMIHGKPQFRKDLEHIAGAHRGVYVAKVSPSHQTDFINKIKKAIQHDGPALIITYANCTTGHRTDTNLTSDQSSLAVESGFWPLFEIENGETRLGLPHPKAYDPRVKPEDKVSLLDWVRSEGRFAMHFDKDGNFHSREQVIEFREAERQLLADWQQLQAEDRLTQRKDKLMKELNDYLRENNEARLRDLTTKPHLFGLGGYTQTYLDELSWMDESGNPKPFLRRVLQQVRRKLDPEAYKIKDPELKDKLYRLFIEEFEILALDHQALRKEHIAKAANAARAQQAIQTASNTRLDMDEIERQKNRAVLGSGSVAGRIFARAGDGGVTAAKMFAGILKEIGLFGKAAPDYGPERRGAPVGTNFTISGKELRTQASSQDLVISIVVNPEDAGWKITQWRDAVVDGGVIIMNTTLSAEAARRRYAIRESVAVVATDASAYRRSHRVPETVTLTAGVLKSLVSRGIEMPEEYTAERLKKILTKEFADKANAGKIVSSNLEAFWGTFNGASMSESNTLLKLDRNRVNTAGYEKSPPDQFMTGSEAVAEVWRQINPGVFAMFPITPSTEVGETFSRFWADGTVDTEFVHTESEHSSFMIIIAAAAAGVRAVTSTASQGMLLGKEGGPLAATLRLPVIVNVGAREVNAPLSIHAGHADFYQFRDDGWLHFITRNAQEAYDFAVIAQKAAEKAMLPAFIVQDGFIVTHNKDMLNTLTDEEVKAFVGEYDPEFSILKTGGTFNPIALQDYYSEHVRNFSEAQNLAPRIVDEVFSEFAELSGRKYSRVHGYRTDDAEVVIVTMGSTEGTAMDAVDELRAEGYKAGALALKVFRPFPHEEIRQMLDHARTVIVMDRANSQGTELTPLATEIQSAINRRVLSLEYGRGGRNTPLALVKEIYMLGFLLGTASDGKQIRKLLEQPDSELIALLEELRLLEGESFADRFIEHLVAGRLIDAFGPREHIDVRETQKRRAIKLRIIEKLTVQEAVRKPGSGGNRAKGKKAEVLH
jgi:pyruvate ferredoxin oxidoreductase alpha subunit